MMRDPCLGTLVPSVSAALACPILRLPSPAANSSPARASTHPLSAPNRIPQTCGGRGPPRRLGSARLVYCLPALRCWRPASRLWLQTLRCAFAVRCGCFAACIVWGSPGATSIDAALPDTS